MGGKNLFIALLFITGFNVFLAAQEKIGLYELPGFRNYIYDSHVKTARVFKTGNENADAIIRLRGDETLTLIFDDLSPLSRRFYYTFTHCNADWKEDNLITSDYMSGFAENPVMDYNISANTRTSYTNYTIVFPNQDVNFKISGNYLLKVYDASTRKLVLQKGFSIFEHLTEVTANTYNSAVNIQRCLQQLEFSISHPSLRVNDAFRDFKVRVEQNSIQYPDIPKPVPAFTQQTTTNYSRPDKNLYPGNNEFRAFDIRNTTYNGIGVNKIQLEQGTYRVLLHEDKLKVYSRYVTEKDNNGKYVIGANFTNHPNTEADYVDVFFTLLTNVPFIEGKVYLLGEFTDWNIDNRYEMIFNPRLNQYEATIRLKQGYYNYRYVILTHDGKLESKPIEGCFTETENEYNIYVYYSLVSDRYDRLIGLTRINSRDDIKK